jgi:hypothetical protein
MTFMAQEIFHTEHLQFEVVDFEMMYNTFLGWLTLTKFMAIPHYAYLVLKMSVHMVSSPSRKMSSAPTIATGRAARW